MENHTQLINEILAAHPERKDKRSELESLITSLQEYEPNAHRDETFKKHLKQKLILLFTQRTMTIPISPVQKRRYAFVGAGSTVVIAGLFTLLSPSLFQNQIVEPPLTTLIAEDKNTIDDVDTVMQKEDNESLSLQTDIEKASTQKFGNIAETFQGGVGGFGGGGGIASSEYAEVDMGTDIANVDPAGEPKRMPYPVDDVLVYSYSFDGVLPQIPANMDVYKFEKDPFSIPRQKNYLPKDLIDVSSLGDLYVQTINLQTKGENGYMIYLDPSQGSISINKQFAYQEYQATPPSKIELAQTERNMNKFIKKFGLDISEYGEPVFIDSYNGIAYAGSDMATLSSMPVVNMLEARYPYMVNEKPVYEQYGGVYGITISYDTTRKEVTGAYNINKHSLISSSYPTIQDQSLLNQYISQGSIYEPYRYEGNNVIDVAIPLEDAEIVYTHMWVRDEATSQQDRYFVPAIKFTVNRDSIDEETKQHPYYYKGNQELIIPIVAELE